MKVYAYKKLMNSYPFLMYRERPTNSLRKLFK